MFLVLSRNGEAQPLPAPTPPPEIKAETAIRDDFASRKARAWKKAPSTRQKFVHFGPVTEIDQQTWRRLSIGQAGPREAAEDAVRHSSKMQTYSEALASPPTCSSEKDQGLNPESDCRYFSYVVPGGLLLPTSGPNPLTAPGMNFNRLSHGWGSPWGERVYEVKWQMSIVILLPPENANDPSQGSFCPQMH